MDSVGRLWFPRRSLGEDGSTGTRSGRSVARAFTIAFSLIEIILANDRRIRRTPGLVACGDRWLAVRVFLVLPSECHQELARGARMVCCVGCDLRTCGDRLHLASVFRVGAFDHQRRTKKRGSMSEPGRCGPDARRSRTEALGPSDWSQTHKSPAGSLTPGRLNLDTSKLKPGPISSRSSSARRSGG